MNNAIDKDSPEVLAFRSFGQEFEHLHTVEMLRNCGNHADANGFQETADLCLDLGWETLSEAGYRHRDIAKFRKASHDKWAQSMPWREADHE